MRVSGEPGVECQQLSTSVESADIAGWSILSAARKFLSSREKARHFH